MNLIFNLLFGPHGPRYKKDISTFTGPNPTLMKALEKVVTLLKPISDTLAKAVELENGFLYMDGQRLADAYKKCQEIEQEVHTIVNNRGQKLHGVLYKAEQPSNKYVFLSHGYGMDGVSEFSAYIPEYHKLGVNCFLIDQYGCGLSEGDFVSFGAQESVDGIQWLEYMIQTFGEDITIGLHGLSMGGSTVALMTGKPNLPDNVKYCITDSPYSSFKAEAAFCASLVHLGEKAQNGIYQFLRKGFQKRFGLDLEETNAVEAVAKATIPMRFIHGSRDILVPIHCSEDLYHACGAPVKDFQAFETASHCQPEFREPERYWSLVKDMVEKYL